MNKHSFGVRVCTQMLLRLFMLLALVRCAHAQNDDDELVSHWFVRQHTNWISAQAACETIVVLFTDADWFNLAMETAAEVTFPHSCVALWIWAMRNDSRLAMYQTEIDCANTRQCALYFYDTRPALHRSSVWGQTAYFNKIVHRVPIMAAIAKRLAPLPYLSLALVDADVALLRRNVFKRIARDSYRRDLVVQQEWPCATAPKRLCVNGGFWWLKIHARSVQFLDTVITLMHALAIPDQDALDLALARASANVSVLYLDRHHYANGWTAQYDKEWNWRVAHIVHANWMHGVANKTKFLERFRRRPLKLLV